MKNDKDLGIEKLQNALLKLPRDDLVTLLKNTYQAMRNKHSIPYYKKNENQEEKISNIEANKIKKNNKQENTQTTKSTSIVTSKTGSSGKGTQPRGEKVDQTKINIFEKRVRVNKQSKNEIKKLENQQRVEIKEMEDGNVTSETHEINFEQMNLNYIKSKDIINKYLNFDDNIEELTFRSQNVEIPQLNLKPALEYIKNKHSQKTIDTRSNKNNINTQKELNNSVLNLDTQHILDKNIQTLLNSRQQGDKQEEQSEKEDEVMTPTFSPKNKPTNLQHFDSCSTNTTINEIHSQSNIRGVTTPETIKKGLHSININNSMVSAKRTNGSSSGVGVPESSSLSYLMSQQFDRHMYNTGYANASHISQSHMSPTRSFMRRSTSLVYQPSAKLVNVSHSYVKPMINYVNPSEGVNGYRGFNQINQLEKITLSKSNYRAYLC